MQHDEISALDLVPLPYPSYAFKKRRIASNESGILINMAPQSGTSRDGRWVWFYCNDELFIIDPQNAEAIVKKSFLDPWRGEYTIHQVVEIKWPQSFFSGLAVFVSNIVGVFMIVINPNASGITLQIQIDAPLSPFYHVVPPSLQDDETWSDTMVYFLNSSAEFLHFSIPDPKKWVRNDFKATAFLGEVPQYVGIAAFSLLEDALEENKYQLCIKSPVNVADQPQVVQCYQSLDSQFLAVWRSDGNLDAWSLSAKSNICSVFCEATQQVPVCSDLSIMSNGKSHPFYILASQGNVLNSWFIHPSSGRVLATKNVEYEDTESVKILPLVASMKSKPYVCEFVLLLEKANNPTKIGYAKDWLESSASNEIDWDFDKLGDEIDFPYLYARASSLNVTNVPVFTKGVVAGCDLVFYSDTESVCLPIEMPIVQEWERMPRWIEGCLLSESIQTIPYVVSQMRNTPPKNLVIAYVTHVACFLGFHDVVIGVLSSPRDPLYTQRFVEDLDYYIGTFLHEHSAKILIILNYVRQFLSTLSLKSEDAIPEHVRHRLDALTARSWALSMIVYFGLIQQGKLQTAPAVSELMQQHMNLEEAAMEIRMDQEDALAAIQQETDDATPTSRPIIFLEEISDGVLLGEETSKGDSSLSQLLFALKIGSFKSDANEMLLVYILLELRYRKIESFEDQGRPITDGLRELIEYSGLSEVVVETTHFLWLLDHLQFELAIKSFTSNTKLSGFEYMVIELLCHFKKYKFALECIKKFKLTSDVSENMKWLVYVYCRNQMIEEAFRVMRQMSDFDPGNQYSVGTIVNMIMTTNRDTKFKRIFSLPLNEDEENAMASWILKSRNHSFYLQLLYYLVGKRRFTKAEKIFQLNRSLKKISDIYELTKYFNEHMASMKDFPSSDQVDAVDPVGASKLGSPDNSMKLLSPQRNIDPSAHMMKGSYTHGARTDVAFDGNKSTAKRLTNTNPRPMPAASPFRSATRTAIKSQTPSVMLSQISQRYVIQPSHFAAKQLDYENTQEGNEDSFSDNLQGDSFVRVSQEDVSRGDNLQNSSLAQSEDITEDDTCMESQQDEKDKESNHGGNETTVTDVDLTDGDTVANDLTGEDCVTGDESTMILEKSNINHRSRGKLHVDLEITVKSRAMVGDSSYISNADTANTTEGNTTRATFVDGDQTISVVDGEEVRDDDILVGLEDADEERAPVSDQDMTSATSVKSADEPLPDANAVTGTPLPELNSSSASISVDVSTTLYDQDDRAQQTHQPTAPDAADSVPEADTCPQNIEHQSTTQESTPNPSPVADTNRSGEIESAPSVSNDGVEGNSAHELLTSLKDGLDQSHHNDAEETASVETDLNADIESQELDLSHGNQSDDQSTSHDIDLDRKTESTMSETKSETTSTRARRGRRRAVDRGRGGSRIPLATLQENSPQRNLRQRQGKRSRNEQATSEMSEEDNLGPDFKSKAQQETNGQTASPISEQKPQQPRRTRSSTRSTTPERASKRREANK
eukprot:TRINITY_DN4777_c0_g2_i3.p1 TRINITY_DN4777_c0_g2~~TRINITY_DN4777_c0_g2_i3.p1  ORF type:complete len:1500 (-),score=301.90 TRINITY_DN4777_c0_g2_i3:228-4727(-)